MWQVAEKMYKMTAIKGEVIFDDEWAPLSHWLQHKNADLQYCGQMASDLKNLHSEHQK